MTNEQILVLFARHDYTTLQEEGMLTPSTVAYACTMGVITREEVERLTGWFY